VQNPYHNQPERAFWKSAVAQRHVADFEELWEPIPLTRSDRVATAGSCFAQHIGRNLKIRGANFMDMEPAPPVFDSVEDARRFGFGVFSCRYGNIYTSRQLLQLAQEALGRRRPKDIVWGKDGRFFDALRPGIDPVGHASEKDLMEDRIRHLSAVAEMLHTLDLFVFTMGLTEGWESAEDGTMFPSAPGTIAGQFDAEIYVPHNLRHGEIKADMEAFWAMLKDINPGARMLLTVSPVPLVATATKDHVLCATTYSKSVLRAVAGDLAADHEDISYFPSYEIITAPPFRGMFFNPDMRTVNQIGVDVVMRQFFSGPLRAEFRHIAEDADDEFEVICDEEEIED